MNDSDSLLPYSLLCRREVVWTEIDTYSLGKVGRGISSDISMEYVPGHLHHLHHRHHIMDGSHLPHGVLSLGGKWSLVSFFFFCCALRHIIYGCNLMLRYHVRWL